MEKILEIKDLYMYYTVKNEYVKAIDGITFDVTEKDSVGVVGESGCGKTSIANTVLRLMPENAEILKGSILFKGTDLVPLSEEEMRDYRWKGISMIFQAAMNALNPVVKVGDQIVEAIKTHESEVSYAEAMERVEELYELVGLPKERIKSYPHEYSGGMKQRAVIAMAFSCNPDIVIADEPTTALDVIVQDQILDKIKEIQEKIGMTMVYISHDISVIAEICNKIMVMYAGNIVEHASSLNLFSEPLHPYTDALLSAYPSIKGEIKKIEAIPGEPPNLMNPPKGCRFSPRCPKKMERCTQENPRLKEIKDEHSVRCHLYE